MQSILITSASLGGLELNLLKSAKALAQRGLPNLLILGQGSPLVARAQELQLNFITLPGPGRKYVDLARAKHLATALKEHHITSVLLSYNPDLDLLAWCLWCFLPKDLRPKVIFWQQMQLGVSKRGLYHHLKHRLIDQWLTPLPWLYREVLEKTTLPEHKLQILPLCLETKEFRPVRAQHRPWSPESGEPFHLGLVGRIDPGKGQREVLQAFAIFHQRYPASRLWFIGNPTAGEERSVKYYNELLQLIKDLKLEKVIHLKSHQHSFQELYGNLHGLVVASERETFGMVTVEGLLSGLEVLGAHSGGTIDLLYHSKRGLTYQLADTEAMAYGMELMMQRSAPRWEERLRQTEILEKEIDFDLLVKIFID